MSAVNAPLADTEKVKTVVLTFDLGRAAGTYDLGVVSGGDVLLLDVIPYVSAAAAGLTTAAIQTNDTTVTVILAATAAVALTAGLNLAALASRVLLPSGKKIQGTVVGIGVSGTIKVVCRYQPCAPGAVLA